MSEKNNGIDAEVKKIYDSKEIMKECDILDAEVVKKVSKMAIETLKKAKE